MVESQLVTQTGLAYSASVERIKNQTTEALTILLVSPAYSDQSIVRYSYNLSSRSCRSDCSGISVSSEHLRLLGNA